MQAYRVAYDGKSYYGFQRQPDVPTISDELLDALRALGVCEEIPPGYAAAGRTDAGVSALAQTVAFDAPAWLTPSAFNSELPAEIRVWARAPADDDFHATHHATERGYTYFLHAPGADETRTRRALDAVAGEQDFHNLTPDETGTVRTLSTGLERDGPFLAVTLRAGGFPRQLVRRVLTVVDAVARGEAGIERIEQVLSAESLDGPDGVGPAAPEPLVLTEVSYPSLSFTVDEDAAKRARAVFDQQRVKRETGARVASVLAEMGTDES